MNDVDLRLGTYWARREGVVAARRGFGSVRKLPSGRYQARFTGPGGERWIAPRTFVTKEHANV